MSDSEDYQVTLVDKRAKNDLVLKSIAGDPSLYFNNSSKRQGIMGMYIEEFIPAGSPIFQKITERTLRIFDSKGLEWDYIEFFGSTINSREGIY